MTYSKQQNWDIEERIRWLNRRITDIKNDLAYFEKELSEINEIKI